MSFYTTFEQQPRPRMASSGAIGASLGFVVGLVVIVAAQHTSLFTTTRAASTVASKVIQPRLAAQLPTQYATTFETSTPVTVDAPTATHPLVYTFSLLSSAAVLAWGAVQMLGSKSPTAMASAAAVKREWVAQSGKKYKGVQPIIAPSLLAADLANLAADSNRVLDAGADVLHVDVMDGHFVPNLSWGAPVIKCLRKHTNAFFDTHLMVSNPEDFIESFADAGVDQFTFHIEAAKDPKALIAAIKKAGMKVGISIKPKTPVETVFPYVEDVDLILVMTVEPGFGGQSFMEDMMPKVKTLREKYPNLDIQVDGGLGPKTIDAAAKAGANAIVAGSATFIPEPKPVIDQMRESVEKYCTGPGM